MWDHQANNLLHKEGASGVLPSRRMASSSSISPPMSVWAWRMHDRSAGVGLCGRWRSLTDE